MLEAALVASAQPKKERGVGDDFGTRIDNKIRSLLHSVVRENVDLKRVNAFLKQQRDEMEKEARELKKKLKRRGFKIFSPEEEQEEPEF